MTQPLRRALQQEPDRVFSIDGDRIRTVAECADRVARLAGGLRSLGLQPGDRVAMLALNTDRFFEYLLGVPWAGGVVNPVNIRWSVEEIAYSLNDCDTQILLVDDTFAVVGAGVRERVPGLRTVVYCGGGATPDGMVGYEDLVAGSEPVPEAGRCGDDLYGVFYTGGTTGFPKGVMLSHRNMVSSVLSIATTADFVTRGGRQLHCAPLFHLAGIGVWAVGQLMQATHVVVPVFSPAAVVEAVAAHRVTDALLVPTMIQLVVDSAQAQGGGLRSLRRIVYGSSPITQAVLGRARALLPGVDFVQAYGMTELAPIATILAPGDHDDPVAVTGAGRAAAGVDVRVVGPDDAELARGEVGELVARGDNVMQGYWGRPEETAETLRGGWMHTGDLGRMDERGYVFVVDRLKDMIITGGENVYSAEVENAVATHPSVAACAVVALPDEQWGERVHAVVVLREGATLTLDDLQAHCRARIAGYKVPRSMQVRDALPVSAAGKILKRELRAVPGESR